ncbi:MAG TPA: tetratricopeptide repeat protein, partial [Myxococcales bacterium]|nr:tetratricopeptide repeat protein [Myxococcales bacterium]
MAGAGFADGSVLHPAGRAATGEAYSWEPLARSRGPGGEGDARRSGPQAALDRAVAAEAAGRYPEAVAEGERALQALEAAPGVAPPDLARCLVWLGEIRWLAGDLARAELLLRRGLAILEAALGTSHPEVAAARNKLALVYQSQGLPGRAEPLHQRALSMQQAVLGRDHVAVATSLNNLALLYKGQGLYERAEPLYERALAIREKALGPGHPDVASSLANLGTLYEAEGRYARAEELLRRALAIQEKALGPGHPAVAISLGRLSSVYAAQQRYGEAEPLAQRALAIRTAALGEGHPDVAASLGALAALCLAQGEAARAEPFARRALALREAALGEGHPDVAASLEAMAQVHLAQRRLDDALPLLWRSLALSEARLRREGLDFSERRLADFLQLLRADEERFYALLRAYPGDARVQRLALAVALLRKGRSVEETASTSRVVYRSLSVLDRDTFERLRALRSQLARVSLAGPGSLGPEGYQRQLKDLADQGDALEAKLARRSGRLRALTALPSPAEIVDQVAGALPEDAVLVELVAYADRAPGAGGPGELRYLAMVLAPGARTAAVDLGPGAAIDAAISRSREALASRDAEYQGPAQALEALVFRPLRPLLGGARRIFIAPDGQLSLVPFAALHDGRRFLVDAFDFTYLTSGKDLLPSPAEVVRSRSVVVLADPDFAARPGGSGAATVAGEPATDARTVAERDYSLPWSRASALRAELAGQAWIPLPGTRREANALRDLFPGAEVYLGA